MQYVLTLIAIFFLSVSAVYAEEEEVDDGVLRLTESDCGQSFSMKPKIEIRLQALTSTGYNWFLVREHPPAKVSNAVTRDAGLLGGEVMNTFYVEPIPPEDQGLNNEFFNLTFVYRRSWEQEIIKKCTFFMTNDDKTSSKSE